MNKPLNFIYLYKKYIPDIHRTGSNGEWVGPCPLPECKNKKKDRFYANEMSGLYHCKICGKAGNIIQFCRIVGEDYRQFCDAQYLPKIDVEAIERWNDRLLAHPDLMRSPWSREVIKRLNIGWDPQLKTEVFPIYNENGEIINAIHHKSHQIKGAKATLYPAHWLPEYDPAYVVVCEGLTDCISLISIDIQAITSTGGATSLPRDISALQRFRRVYLCFDVDAAGEAGCDIWISRLLAEMN